MAAGDSGGRGRVVSFLCKHLKTIVLWVLILAAGLAVEQMITAIFSNPDSYKVYVVGDFSSPAAKELCLEVEQGFREKGDPQVRLEGVPIVIETRDDQGQEQRARTLASELAAGKDTLMVAGHMFSTTSRAALPSYLEGADPPVPVLLATETNPELLPTQDRAAGGRGKALDAPVFRLPPTDDLQGRQAARFARETMGSKACWVVEDSYNPVYSRYLAEEFFRGTQPEPGHPQPGLQQSPVILWSSHLNVLSLDTFQALGIDCVFFPGRWSHGLVLVRQVRALARKLSGPQPDPSKPVIILSESAVDRNLIVQGGRDVEGVYVLHPLSADDFNEKGGGNRTFGRNARLVFDELIGTASRNFHQLRTGQPEGSTLYRLRSLLGIRRVADARRVLIGAMLNAMDSQQKFSLSGGGRVSFVRGMRNEGPRFHIWQVRNGQFEE